MVTQSPSLNFRPLMVAVLPTMTTSLQPATQGVPMPRATTAAWEVMPPVAVRMPWATCMPPMSSGEVSLRTSSTFLPSLAHFSASSAVNTICPAAAPGEALRPLARGLASRRCLGSIMGCRSWSS